MDQEPMGSPAPSAPVAPAAPAPQPAPAMVMPVEPKKTPYGTILGILLIVVILVVGAFYVWGARLAQMQPADNTQQPAPSVNVQVNTPQPQ